MFCAKEIKVSDCETLVRSQRTYQCSRDSDRLCGRESDTEVSFFVVGSEAFIRDLVLEIGVKNGTEGHSVVPRAAEVSDVNILIAWRPALTPFEQCVPLRTVASHHQRWQRIGWLLFDHRWRITMEWQTNKVIQEINFGQTYPFVLLESLVVFSLRIWSIGLCLAVDGVVGGESTGLTAPLGLTWEQTLLFSSLTSQLIDNMTREPVLHLLRLMISSVINGSDEQLISRLILVLDRGRATGHGFCLCAVSIESISRLTDNWLLARLSLHLLTVRRHVCRSVGELTVGADEPLL